MRIDGEGLDRKVLAFDECSFANLRITRFVH